MLGSLSLTLPSPWAADYRLLSLSNSSLNEMVLTAGRRAHVRDLSVSNRHDHRVVCNLERMSFLFSNMMPLESI